MYNSLDGVFEPLERQGPHVLTCLPLLAGFRHDTPKVRSLTNYWNLGSNTISLPHFKL